VTIVVSLLAQLLHMALLAVAAPTLIGVIRWMGARLEGSAGPPVLEPWHDLRRLLRKQTMLAESASDVTGIALAVQAAAILIAACLVPSFTLGMVFAPVSDLVAIGGLLVLARVSLALAAMDAGTTGGGMGASRIMLLACVAEPALLLVVFVLALLAGSSNLDLIAAMQIETGTAWRAGVTIALGATLLLAWAEGQFRPAIATEFSGRDLALFDAAEMLRLLMWFNLLGAAFLPYGMAPTAVGAAGWLAGLGAWLCRTMLFAISLVVLNAVTGRLRLWQSVRLLGVAMLFALLAAVFLFAGMGTA